MQFIRKNYQNIALLTLGTFIFCLGVHLFISPLHLYNGGALGFSQMIQTLLEDNNIKFGFDVSGVINVMLNVPLMFLAFKYVSKRFFRLTLLSVILQAIFFAIIPIIVPIIDDHVAGVLVGGVCAGYGMGLALRAHGSGGGIDILGVFFTKKFANFSVGKFAIIVNSILFSLCAILFSPEIAIYSILYVVFYTFVVDKVHYQNIEMSVLIFTKHKDVVKKIIIEDMHRGVTYWRGKGGYTDEDTYILMTAISKYEVSHFRNRIKKLDKEAFIIFSESSSITGNFEKRL